MIRTSKKTGLFICIVGVIFAGIGVVTVALAVMENQSFKSEGERWALLSCDDMEKDFNKDPKSWKWGQIVSSNCVPNKLDTP